MDVYLPRGVLKSRPGLISLFIILIMFVLDFPVVDLPTNFLVRNAEAVIGRPASPGSIAGVRRRTRRRTLRRWAVGTRMYTLPVGYTTAVVAGTTYYVHQGEYFKPSYEGNDVVYVAVDAQAQPAQTQPASTGTVEQELLELKNLYDKGLIDKKEYEDKKKEILDSM